MLQVGARAVLGQGPKKVGSLANARAETVHEKPSFRVPFKSRRALIPVDAFYEWLETDKVSETSGKKLKQPFVLRPAEGTTLALAGLYEYWRDKNEPDDDPEAWIRSYTIITTTATHAVGRIHDRMPMAIAKANWADWLDPRNQSTQDVLALMAPPIDDNLDIYAVSRAVNNVRNNGPDLLLPLDLS